MDTERRYTTAVPGERPTSQAQLVPDVDNALFFVSHGYLHYSGDVCESIDVEAHAAQVTGGYIYIIIRTHPHVYTSYFVLTSVLPLNSRMANVEHTNNINSIRKTMPRFVCFSLV